MSKEGDSTANSGVVVKPAERKRDWVATVTIPLIVAFVAIAGSGLGSWISNYLSREQTVEQFRRDQRKDQYAAILQQATRLENAGSFSSSRATAGLPLLGDLQNPAAPVITGPSIQNPASEASDMVEGVLGALGPSTSYGAARPYFYDGYYWRNPPLKAAAEGSWQDAYTSLDQAISNAEIVATSDAIEIARALRDRYRNDYRESIMENIDGIVAKFPDPKPDRQKLADAIVGVPADTDPRAYPTELSTKSTDDLKQMYVDKAQEDLNFKDPD